MKNISAAALASVRNLSLADATVAELGETYAVVFGVWDHRALSGAIVRELRRRGAVTNRYGDWVAA